MLIFVNKVYIDLLKKSNCDKSFLRSAELISNMIEKGHIEDSYVLIRSTYEELMGLLSKMFNPQFNIDAKISPKEIRDEVIRGVNTLFENETIDSKLLNEMYAYLSNVSHESSTRNLLRNLVNDNKFTYVISCHTYFNLSIISYIYLNHIYKNKEELSLANKLFVIGICNLLVAMQNVLATLTREEIEKYNAYFFTQRDQNFINKIKTEALEMTNDLKQNPITDLELTEYVSDINNLIEKFHYKELYNEFFSNK